jgi:hypothetical protein
MVGSLGEGGCLKEEMFFLGSGLLLYEMVFGEEGCFEKRTMLSRKDVLERT